MRGPARQIAGRQAREHRVDAPEGRPGVDTASLAATGASRLGSP
jgi:hypothetical protein